MMNLFLMHQTIFADCLIRFRRSNSEGAAQISEKKIFHNSEIDLPKLEAFATAAATISNQGKTCNFNFRISLNSLAGTAEGSETTDMQHRVLYVCNFINITAPATAAITAGVRPQTAR